MRASPAMLAPSAVMVSPLFPVIVPSTVRKPWIKDTEANQSLRSAWVRHRSTSMIEYGRNPTYGEDDAVDGRDDAPRKGHRACVKVGKGW